MAPTGDDRDHDPADHDPADHSEEIAEVQEQLDDEAEGDGLAAESGKGEETGLSQG